MAMLEVICNDCKTETSLRGWVEKEDLKGNSYENLTDTITEDELYALQEDKKIKDPWRKIKKLKIHGISLTKIKFVRIVAPKT